MTMTMINTQPSDAVRLLLIGLLSVAVIGVSQNSCCITTDAFVVVTNVAPQQQQRQQRHHNHCCNHHHHVNRKSSSLSSTIKTILYSMESIRSGMDGTFRPSPQLFDLDGWKRIEQDLDRFPLWTVATAQGEPLAYTVTVLTQTYTVPFFWCDLSEALSELETSREKTALDGLGIIPLTLGAAFKMWCDDSCVIVPSRASVLQAGHWQAGAGGST
jgi:hypothetical protein